LRQKIDLGSGLVALGALVLLVSLFLEWYDIGASAWDVFEVVDVLLAAAALAALAGVVQTVRDGAAPRWLPPVVLAALVLVIVSIIDRPPAVSNS